MQISANKALVATTSYSSRTSSAPAGRARTIRRSKPVSIPLPLFHFIFAALLLGTPLARAEPRDSAFACAIPTPEFPANKPASKGINLGLIAKQNLGFYGAYKATVEPTVQLDFGRDEEIVNLTQSRADKKLVFEPSRDGYRVLETARLELGLGANFNFEFGNSTFLSQNLFAEIGRAHV